MDVLLTTSDLRGKCGIKIKEVAVEARFTYATPRTCPPHHKRRPHPEALYCAR